MTNQQPQQIAISELDPHPKNPRLVQREDVIEAIMASIVNGFDAAHSIIVRPVGDRFQIISGHNRVTAASRAGLASISAWVREMDDETAYMELVRANAQGELSALERGMHALGATEKGSKLGKSVKAYSGDIGRAERTVSREVAAASVAVGSQFAQLGELLDYHRHLSEIHAAPRWLWPALVAKLVENSLTVEQTRKAVADVKEAPEPAEWMNSEAIAAAIVSGSMRALEAQQMAVSVQRAEENIRRTDCEAATYLGMLAAKLLAGKPSRLSEVMTICNSVEEEQAAEAAKARREAAAKQQEQQDREARIASMKSSVSLAEWKTLDEPTQRMLLDPEQIGATGSFQKQDSDAIEWAQWSWNPISGCEHPCPYCYARDLTERFPKMYPHGFDPAFRPVMLSAPSRTRVPEEAVRDTRFKNVFTGSMSDIFGRWIPAEWIEAIFDSVRANPQWNFLFLTKFPKRMAEFDIPENAWMGTSVDLQARVKNAEAAFEKVTAGVRWLSVEPMLEPLKFERLDLFQWIVIGGASRSSKTPEWKPPFEWVADLTAQAKAAGVKVYHKTNLLGSRVLELPFDAPIVGDLQQAPPQFQYLGKAKREIEAA